MAGVVSRVTALPCGLDLDEACKRVVNADGIIRTRFEISELRLADGSHGGQRKPTKFGEVRDQLLNGCPELVFRFAVNCRAGEFCFYGLSELRTGNVQRKLCHASPPVA